jgi:hypothetical protein
VRVKLLLLLLLLFTSIHGQNVGLVHGLLGISALPMAANKEHTTGYNVMQTFKKCYQ